MFYAQWIHIFCDHVSSKTIFHHIFFSRRNAVFCKLEVWIELNPRKEVSSKPIHGFCINLSAARTVRRAILICLDFVIHFIQSASCMHLNSSYPFIFKAGNFSSDIAFSHEKLIFFPRASHPKNLIRRHLKIK